MVVVKTMFFSTCSDLRKYKALVLRCLRGTLWCAESLSAYTYDIPEIYLEHVVLSIRAIKKFNTNFFIQVKLMVLILR